jgi:ribonuclease E
MGMKILINAVDPEECRVAIIKNNRLEEFYIESAAREITQGNIYKGAITRIEPQGRHHPNRAEPSSRVC